LELADGLRTIRAILEEVGRALSSAPERAEVAEFFWSAYQVGLFRPVRQR
jgi:hypothetical protein